MATSDPPNLHGGPEIVIPPNPTAPFIRSPYNYNWKAASDATAIAPGGPSLTVQSMTEDSDLNVMMKRFGVTGHLPEAARLPQYGDFTGITNYQDALHAIQIADDSFMSFPAEIRSRFENNPQLFLDFVENPANVETVKQWFPKQEKLNATVSGSSGEQSPLRSESHSGSAPQNNPSGDATPQRSGGAPGASASGK